VFGHERLPSANAGGGTNGVPVKGQKRAWSGASILENDGSDI
jgi:hypothetical protein